MGYFAEKSVTINEKIPAKQNAYCILSHENRN